MQIFAGPSVALGRTFGNPFRRSGDGGGGCLVRVGGARGVLPGGLKAHCPLYWWKLSSFSFWFFSQLRPCFCTGCT